MRTVVIRGVPKPQPMPRATAYIPRGETKPKARVYDSGKTKIWRQTIANELVKNGFHGLGLTGALSVRLTFYLPRPKRLKRKKDPRGLIAHPAKPDCEQLSKPVLDVLQQEGVFKNDSQVYALLITKWYTKVFKDERQEQFVGCVIEIQ